MTLRRLLTRRRPKWAGVVAAVVVIGAGAASCLWGQALMGFGIPATSIRIGFLLNSGAFFFIIDDTGPHEGIPPREDKPLIRFSSHHGRFKAPLSGFDPREGWLDVGSVRQYQIPLWLPLLLIAAPTA